MKAYELMKVLEKCDPEADIVVTSVGYDPTDDTNRDDTKGTYAIEKTTLGNAPMIIILT